MRNRSILGSACLVVVVLVSLVACGGRQDTSEVPAPTSARSSTASPVAAAPDAQVEGVMGAAGAPSFGWVHQVDEFVSAAGRTFPENYAVLDDVSRSALDDLIETAPRVLSAAQRQKLMTLTAMSSYLDAVAAAGTNVEVRWLGVTFDLRSGVGLFVKRGLSRPNKDKLVDLLADEAISMARDVACDVAWGQLTAADRTSANALVESQAYEPLLTSWGRGVLRQTEESIKEAIADRIDDGMLELLIPKRFVDRLSYADDVYDKAVGLMQDGGEGAIPAYLTYPTAKAFYYFVRICLVPPR